MRKIEALVRIALAGITVVMLVVGIAYERHTIKFLHGGSEVEFSGPEYVEGATFEQFARYGETLVTPLGAASARQKDCKT
jgi:hypothetical protein